MSAFLYAASAAVARVLTPINAAVYKRRTAPFIHRGKRGLLFELRPGEEIDRHIATYGIYEDRLLRYLRHVLPQSSVMIDVGANIGNHALFLADRCEVVHCFEPNPMAYQRLERHVALNNASNVVVHRYGLGDREHVATFQANVSGNIGASRFGDAPMEGCELLELPIINADDAISALRLSRLDLIKVDVEGMESVVLPAMTETIARFQPLVVFEYSGHLSSEDDWNKIRAALSDYTIAEPQFGGLSGLLRGGLPDFRKVGAIPEPRWYDCLIALPAKCV